MSAHPEINTLREMVARDQTIFKAQIQRLTEIQQSDPNTLSDADKNSLSNWDKSVVTNCERQLLTLEDIEQPTADERAIMQELNKLISLGDHIMEKRNLVRRELNDRLNAMKKSKATKDKTTSTPRDATPPSAQSPSTPHVHFKEEVTEIEIGGGIDAVDPKVLYKILKMEPGAPLKDIKKKAKRTTLLLHPDRNRNDPNAASRFADFQAACKVFESEQWRQEFDDTGDVKELQDLQTALKGLMVEGKSVSDW